MKARSFTLVVVIITVIAAIWLFTQPREPNADTPAPASASAKTDASKPAIPAVSAPTMAPKPAIVAQVEKPTVAPVQPSTSQPATAMANAPVAEPRANLDTTIAEATRLLEAKDFVTLLKEFAPPEAMDHLPQGMTLDQMAQMMQADPRADVEMQNMLDALRSSQSQTPTMSDNDNTATYEATLPDGSTKSVVLKKADTGLWYIEDM